MVDTISVMTEEEVQNELGFGGIVHAGFSDDDNPTVDSVLRGKAPRQDKEGRQIISFRQYKELSRLGHRLDNYAMLMRWPTSTKANPIQASKYLKWYGLGYDAVGAPLDETHAYRELVLEFKDAGMEEDMAEKRAKAELGGFGTSVIPTVVADDDVRYKCSDKYADCKRFFDNPRGLKMHQLKDHQEVQFKK